MLKFEQTISWLCNIFVIGMALLFIGIAVTYPTPQTNPLDPHTNLWIETVRLLAYTSGGISMMAMAAVLPLTISHAFISVVRDWAIRKP